MSIERLSVDIHSPYECYECQLKDVQCLNGALCSLPTAVKLLYTQIKIKIKPLVKCFEYSACLMIINWAIVDINILEYDIVHVNVDVNRKCF